MLDARGKQAGNSLDVPRSMTYPVTESIEPIETHDRH